MPEKPKYALEYKSEQVELVRGTCLYVATKLGDMMDDLLIVGGDESDHQIHHFVWFVGSRNGR